MILDSSGVANKKYSIRCCQSKLTTIFAMYARCKNDVEFSNPFKLLIVTYVFILTSPEDFAFKMLQSFYFSLSFSV